jgi:hypothetical protein
MSASATPVTNGLSAQCADIAAGAGQAIEWVRDVRKHARRLDNEADKLIEDLRRSRNLCRRLGGAAQRPLSIGVFGMSQAGKSYLISTLARGASGQLRTTLDGAQLDFISHINPPGGGKEATGLVTRFTRQAGRAPAGFPIELTLFSEADLVKILGNSFFNDFDRERRKFDTEPEHIRAHLAEFERQRQPNPTGGLDEDDMVDLLDYFTHRYGESMKTLKADYWPAVIELAPRLSAAARGKLLSILWGEGNTAFTDVYVKMRNALEGLGYARTVFVPLEALVNPAGGGYEWSPDSILNVDVLGRLNKPGGKALTVLPVAADGTVGAQAGVDRAMLAALTAEMKFVLADPPLANMLETVDLLDFPGYRGRLAIADLDDVRKDPKTAESDPVAELLLRGKVGYLFERYTDDQEMNVLIMCTRCDIQIEITALAPVLDGWVKSTQGTAAERAERPPGLIWVITQLDKRLAPVPGQSDKAMDELWGGMVHITLLERFGKCEWLQEWSNGRPFDNVFLMRKPGYMGSVIETEERGNGETHEGELRPGERERLDRLRDTFARNDNVVRHIRDAEEAWAALLEPNDGGMGRLAGYLQTVSAPEIKLNRIAEQVAGTRANLIDRRLAGYFQADGIGEMEKKTQLAGAVSAAIEEHDLAFGELVLAMQPPAEHLRRLYLSADAAQQNREGQASAEIDKGKPRSRSEELRGKLKSGGVQQQPAPAAGRAGLFAQAVLREWIKQLRDLPVDLEMRRFLDLPADVLQAITDELITASDRCRVEERLVEALRPLEDRRSTTRAGIVDQQVLLARAVVNDFVDFAGIAGTPLEDRPPSPVDGRKVFEPPSPVPPGALPALPEDEVPYAAMYVLDWLEAFRTLAIGNAGHSAGREITPEQNQRLGAIFKVMRGGAVVPVGEGSASA